MQTIHGSLREFKVSNDIWGSTLSIFGVNNRFESTFTIDNDINVFDIGYSSLAQTSYVGYQFSIYSTMFEVTVEPDSVIVAITKIGALLGLFRLFIFITALNEW